MPALMYSLAALMIIVGSLDFSLFVFKNPASMAVGIAGLAVWWTVGITIAVKAVLKTRPAPKQPQAPHETAGYAGFWRRAAASVIDTVILVISGAILGGLLGGIVGAYLGANGADVPAIEHI